MEVPRSHAIFIVILIRNCVVLYLWLTSRIALKNIKLARQFDMKAEKRIEKQLYLKDKGKIKRYI